MLQSLLQAAAPYLINVTLPFAVFTGSPANWYLHIHTKMAVPVSCPLKVPSQPCSGLFVWNTRLPQRLNTWSWNSFTLAGNFAAEDAIRPNISAW